MNLRNNEITVGEVLSNPAAKDLFMREFPEVSNPLMLAMANNMTLASIIALAQSRYPPEKINRVLAELQAL